MAIKEVALTGKASDFLKIGVAAAGRGDLHSVEKILDLRPDWISRTGSHGRTMLWEAAYRGRTTVVEYLIQRGADIDVCACHFTPLLVDISAYCAAKYKKRESTADLLLKCGAAIDFFTNVYLGDIHQVRKQLDADSSLATKEKVQNDRNVSATALHYAVSTGRTEILDLLLANGADPIPYSYWLIRFAIWRENVTILRKLFDAGVDRDLAAVPRSGVTNPEIIAALNDFGIPYQPNLAEGGWPPLVYASRGDRGGNLEAVRKLLDQGADVNCRNYKEQTALHCAAKAGFVDIVELLLCRGAAVDARDREGNTPLMTAIQSNIKRKDRLLEVASHLLRAGADVKQENDRGRTPWSAAYGKRDNSAWLQRLQSL